MATAVAIRAQFPAHWASGIVGAVITVSGPDIFAAQAIETCTVSLSYPSDAQFVEIVRREATVQCTIWTQLDTATGRPARFDPTGCDTMAIKVQDALRQVVPDPYRVYIHPQPNLRPFEESYTDGKEYLGTTFDTRVTWADIVSEFAYTDMTGAPDAVELVEAAEGTITSSDGVASPVVALWSVDSTP